MALLEIRQLFVERSGNYNLVEDANAYADAGANALINKGIRYLDNQYETPDSLASLVVTITGGAPIVEVPGLRAPHRVYYDHTDGPVELIKMALHEIQTEYKYAVSFSDIDAGKPKHYAIAIRRQVGVAGTEDDTDIRLVILPVEATDRAVTVEGLFYSKVLTDDTHSNWWVLQHEGLVVEAALLAMERGFRNFQGVRDHVGVIDADLMKIDANWVEGESSNLDVLRDSW